ncbi:hypothetical protein ACFFX0_05555 [Citricoccus parietis]|uniref:Uncharacterized protein n=1 Tax=Citricoccus parietis TaxID=592307 RepID=A0ABV5FVH1_9MICC
MPATLEPRSCGQGRRKTGRPRAGGAPGHTEHRVCSAVLRPHDTAFFHLEFRQVGRLGVLSRRALLLVSAGPFLGAAFGVVRGAASIRVRR